MPFRPAPRVSWAATLFALAVSVAPAVALPFAQRDVRQLTTSATGTQFEVAVPEVQLSAIGDESGGAAVRVEIDGYSPSDTPEEAALPVRVVTVAVPPTGAVSVRGIGLDETSRDGVEVAMAPWLGSAGPGPDEHPSTPAVECAHLIEVGWMRHQRIARIEVRPTRWDAATKRLTVFGRISVSVDVGPSNAPTATPAAPDSDAFESVYRNLLLNYEQGRGWRSPNRTWSSGRAGISGSGRLASRAASLQILAPDVPDSSLYVGRRWIKIAVRRTGFYRLAFSRLRSLAPFNGDTTVVSDSLRLYTWAGHPILPEAVYCDSCGYSEVALGIVDDDGRMNHTGDAIYFYALGPSDWADRFDSSLSDTVFVNHPYEARNFYYLGVSTAAQTLPGPRRRISTRDGTPTGGGATTPATFPARVHQELDAKYDPNLYPWNSTYFWDKFIWAKLKELDSFTATTDAPFADSTQGARLRARLYSVFTGGSCADQRSFADVTWDGAPAGVGRFVWSGFNPYTIDTHVDSLHSRFNSLRMTMSDLRCNNEIAVSWFDLFYQRMYVPSFERLDFRAPVGGGLLRYRIAPFQNATRPRLFDTTDPLAPIEITGATYTPVTGGQELSFESSDNSSRRYTAFQDTSFFDVLTTDLTGASGTSLDNLRGHTQQADFVVIYYDEFQAAADTLATWRRGHNGFRTKIVPISAIYDQFSGGRTDPTAIRNFLRAAYYNWGTQPSYVTFLGDASFDFKNLNGQALPGQPGSPLPTFENNFESASLRQYTTDDWLLNVDDPDVILPDFLTGRLPVPDAATAMNVVRTKVLAYERAAPMGLYRDRIMLIADDNEQGSEPDGLDWKHLEQTTQLDTLSTPANFDRVYIYLHTYEGADTKPGARLDILANMNGEGVAVVNFIGHGSPYKIADESVLLASDVGTLSNGTRLPLFIAASCDVGRFSDPTNTSLGEGLLLRSGGGAIGVISATDLAYSGQNAQLNGVMYQSLFARQAQGGFSGEVAKALLVGKLDALQHASGTNAQKYQLMGDAVTRLNLPELWVELKIKDDGGLDTTAMQQGRKFTFTGRVLDRPNGTLVPLEGSVDIMIDDAAPILRAPRCSLPGTNCDPTPFYLYKAGSIYRGSTDVHAGLLSGVFMVPIEARPGPRGKIRAYVTGSVGGVPVVNDAAGSQKLRVVTGSAPPGDVRGPEIRLSFPGGATRVRNDATLRIDLADSSGILITGHTPQNGIVVTLDGNTTSREEVTESFRYNPGSFQAGTASFPLPRPPLTPLANGFHIVTVSAADNLAAGLAAGQHRTQASLEFEVVETPPLRVTSAYLFPDPTGSKGGYSGGEFVVNTEGGRVDLELRIFSVSGRVLRLLKVSGEGQVQVPWDGLDAEGQGLANGVYLFKVAAHSSGPGPSTGSEQSADTQGKFVVLNP